MKKIISILSFMFVGVAMGAGENIPTSKSYVDGALSEKQDAIAATSGAPQVLTNTGTDGEYGTADIYNATGVYGEQLESLVDAGTMNMAMQNAIDSEFQCVEWLNPNDHTSECLLMDVFGTTERRSPNLFDKNDSRIIYGRWVHYDTNYIGQNFYSVNKITSVNFCISGPIMVEPNKTYTVSNHKSADNSMTNPSFVFLDKDFIVLDGFGNSGRATVTFTVPNNDNIKYVVLPCNTNQLDVLQIEEGTVATPYQPYGNVYLPMGAQ